MVIKKILKYFKFLLLNEAYQFESKKNIRIRMRGYFKFYSNKKKENIPLKIKKALTNLKLKSVLKENKILLNLFFGNKDVDKELLIRQFLLMRFGYFNFNRSLYYSKGLKKSIFVHPIPKDWYYIIEKNNIKINRFKCNLLFILNQFIHFFLGLFSIFGVVFSNFKFSNKVYKETYSVFYNAVSEKCFYHQANNKKNNSSYSLLDWYINNKNTKEQRIKLIIHNKKINSFKYGNTKVLYMKNLFPRLDFHMYPLFFFHSFILSLISLISIFLGKWYYSLLLKDTIINTYVKYCRIELLAKQYLFDNSNFVYRPMWTHEIEKKKSDIICYFYSTNCREIEIGKKDSTIGWGYGAMNWPIYYVWDNYQKRFIQEMSNLNKKIITNGPIYFIDKNVALKNLNKKIITVFDVHPRRESIIRSRIEPIFYYNKNTICKFLEDIFSLSNELNFHIYLKQKRKLTSEIHCKYRNLVKKISAQENVTMIDSDVSPVRLIKNSDLSISVPFTSSSLYAREMGKKTIYYDSQKIISKKNIASHGLEIVLGKEELRNWIFNNL